MINVSAASWPARMYRMSASLMQKFDAESPEDNGDGHPCI